MARIEIKDLNYSIIESTSGETILGGIDIVGILTSGNIHQDITGNNAVGIQLNTTVYNFVFNFNFYFL